MSDSDLSDADYLRRYDDMANRAAAAVIAEYSTSFGMSSNLLSPAVRRDIRNLYAMVRIADEIVDGTAAVAGVTDPSRALDSYEQQIRNAPNLRFHTDPVVHAYAQTARHCNFKDEHVAAFFRSMRRDLTQTQHTDETLDDYIYGSAEVIGLLCLAAFYADRTVSPQQYGELENGARSLGAAFQKINFLRDVREDTVSLGRTYFPGTEHHLNNAAKDEIVASIRKDLVVARGVIPELPLSARAGVLAATELFTELTERIDDIDAAELVRTRISVPARRKALLIARSVARAPLLKGSSS
ncbi:phytoene/squalene synthase family protein [Corynebacterium cystitidis]|uniref:phytoene/squalene synthase family protein n=1 Tax=Corynebacterium cystitidis TaxID=35757 RepID=UPI00211DE15F|nr:phytoene/squalene synthase family protein [Corynebacterium cystitidis]